MHTLDDYKKWLLLDGGKFYWLAHWKRTDVIGKEAGHISDNGYSMVSIFRKHIRAHRLAWMFHYGEFPSKKIDHINGNRLDNRIENLREVDDRQNRQNAGIQRNNTSGHTGVSKRKVQQDYEAYIKVNKKRIHLGVFKFIDDAIAAREYAKSIHHTFNPVEVNRKSWSAEHC